MRNFSTWLRWLRQQPGSVDLRRYERLLQDITSREEQISALSDDELTDAVSVLTRPSDVVQFCALGREAAVRTLGQRPYDVQLLGTMAMLDGLVAEMATGEGKTLSGALTAAGYALRGRSVQIWAVNEYLARRDAAWMRPLYDLLGVSVGWITPSSSAEERRAAYAADVTYAPVSEVGFDVLRDRLCTDPAQLVAPAPDVVLIDEADSVLVDEAMVPLVLAGAAPGSDIDRRMSALAGRLIPDVHYEVDEDGRNVHLTTDGVALAERELGGINLYTSEHAETFTSLNVAVHAEALLHRDVDYIVSDDRIHLVNESRGRVARLQRWPDGLQAAVEAKEGVRASETGEILDSLTVQALVRLYPTVCGMTGTAVSVGEELREFYQLEVAVIPPHRPCIRIDEPSRVYASLQAKEDAIVEEVVAAHDRGTPVLLGTPDVAASERMAARLVGRGLVCEVLNAKNDEAEAAIVARAGVLGTITVSTQMAGRGTDIRLGGSFSDEDGEAAAVAAAGGLLVIATDRHPSSRLDLQLRGRSGRQGDPGRSVVFTSLEDALIVHHTPDLSWSGATEGDGRIVSPQIVPAVDHAQRVAEGARREIHRNTWRYHTVLEQQRRIVLEHRERMLRSDAALTFMSGACGGRVEQLRTEFSEEVLVRAARQVTLWHLDHEWADHLARIADLREGIHLRGLGRGMNPLDEFNRELIAWFGSLLEEVETRSVETFRTVLITEDGADLGGSGFSRPTATWTYMVKDNPFGGDFDRMLGSVARILRSKR
jgi:preprotein translocase subunit SecA